MTNRPMSRPHDLPSAGMAAAAIVAMLSSIGSASAATINGKAVFDSNCAMCHSIQPPPKSAPPLMAISSRYHQQFASRQHAVRYMVEYMKSPSKAKMVTDPLAIEHFGLMPDIRLGDGELNAVAGWIWDRYDAEGRRAGRKTGLGSGVLRLKP